MNYKLLSAVLHTLRLKEIQILQWIIHFKLHLYIKRIKLTLFPDSQFL